MQEEERLKQDKTESAHLASTSKDKAKKRKRNTNKNKASKGPTQKKQNKDENNCFFCKKFGHVKKKCTKYHAWRAKKGMFLTLVCSENNLASVPRNTWWLDFGATSNISVSMQGCLSYRKPISAEIYVCVGDGKSMEVKVVGHFRLLLCIGFYLDLKDTFVVPSFRQNFISIACLDKSRYSCSFGNNQVNLSLNLKVIGTG